jgi:hypothetical protein
MTGPNTGSRSLRWSSVEAGPSGRDAGAMDTQCYHTIREWRSRCALRLSTVFWTQARSTARDPAPPEPALGSALLRS